MYRDHTVALIVAASGTGKRMGSAVPKQFLPVSGKPCLRKTVEVFTGMDIFDRIVVTAPLAYMTETEEILQGLPVSIVAGGEKRGDSVSKALKEVTEELVLIHDGARPFITSDVVINVLDEVVKTGSAVPAVRPKDTVRTMEKTLKRDELFLVQTPQGFKTKIISDAYAKAFDEGFEGTDDASVAEHYGCRIGIVEGSYDNIKITTAEDMPVSFRIGKGTDVHKIVEGRDLILGGVKIPFEKGLDGHSDADVLVHAIMDALLGASDSGDIGKLFPDTDPAFKGASSLILLETVGGILKDRGYIIENIDSVVICQRPKIAPYIPEMKKKIAKALGISEGQISIKGTTTEKLGFTGTGEGIAGEAVCILKR